jgi:hypothetical protein
MRRRIDVQKLVAALWGGSGAFVLGFFGGEAMFAPLSEGVTPAATLIPSAIAAVAA